MMSESAPRETRLPTTEFGLPIDESFARPASEEQLQRAAAALRARGITVELVDSLAAARELTLTLLPADQSVFTASSETVRQSGLAEIIDRSGRFQSVRARLAQLSPATQMREMVRLGAAPDVLVGSAHAVTEEGEVVIASASGSQLGPISAGAAKVLLLVGAQKVVADRAAAMRRLQFYALPKEDVRARAAYGRGSALAKTLVIDREVVPGRLTVILIRAPVGY